MEDIHYCMAFVIIQMRDNNGGTKQVVMEIKKMKKVDKNIVEIGLTGLWWKVCRKECWATGSFLL